MKGVFLGMKAAFPVLPKPGGVIVNMSSLAGLGGVRCSAPTPPARPAWCS